MTTTTKLVATALLAGGILATTGFGLTQGVGGDGPPTPPVKAAPPAKADRPKVPDAKPDEGELAATAPRPTESVVREQLSAPCVKFKLVTTLGELIVVLREHYNLSVRLDLAGYKRMASHPGDGGEADFTEFSKGLYEKKLEFFTSNGVSIQDILTDTCAQLPGKNSFRIRDGQILIGPAFQAPAMPNRVSMNGENIIIEYSRIAKQVLGEPVSLSLKEVPFHQAIGEIRRITGANIVIDFRNIEGGGKAMLTATFDDVPLYSALEVLGDMAGLKPVFLNNVYYLTSPSNAEKLQKKVNEELFGREQKPLAVPAGYLTDGINLYLNPGNLKPEVNNGSLGGGLGIVPGVEPAPPVPAPAAKK